MRVTPAPIAQLAALGGRAWLVGGAVRDAILGRPTTDFDLAVEGDARGLARGLGRAAGGHAFALSDAYGAWRVVSAHGDWQVDLTPLTGPTLEQDLAHRDLTVNAIAMRLDGGGPIDPFGGVTDLEAGVLRMVGPQAFGMDPLRTVRLTRLATELRFRIDPATWDAARAAAPALRDTAAERVFAELRQIICSDRAVAGLELLESVGAADVVLPELPAMRGVEQSAYHHLDVHDHTMATVQATIDLCRDPEGVFGDAEVGAALRGVLDAPLGNELSRGQALRFGALLHDVAKPLTRAVTPEGRITFFDHDRRGAELSREILGRLRASDRLAAFVASLARDHLRLGFLVHETPLPRRTVYRYLRECEPTEVEVTVLSVADRLATRGRRAEEAIGTHLALAREMLPEALRWRAHPPSAPIRGDRLAAALGIAPGPDVGRALTELAEAAFAGEVDGEQQAIAHARAWLAHAPGPGR